MFTKAINERAAKANQLASEIAELTSAESALQNQKAELTAALAQFAPSGFILDNEGKNGDAEVDAQLAQLNRINTKLNLLPGIRARLQKELAAVDRDLALDLERAQADARAQARAKLDTIRTKFDDLLLPLCGGDPVRSSAAVEAIVAQTEVFQWYDAFKKGVLLDGGTVAAKLQNFQKHLARFNAGENVRSK
jgi:chromosome segregation ATPase